MNQKNQEQQLKMSMFPSCGISTASNFCRIKLYHTDLSLHYPPEATDTEPDPTQDEEEEELSLTQELLSQEEAGPRSQTKTECRIPPLLPPKKRARKSQLLDGATAEFLTRATAVITTAPDSAEGFGCFTANKLSEIDAYQRELCEGIIIQLLSKARKRELTTKSHVCHLDHTPPPPPQQAYPPQQTYPPLQTYPPQ
ncbi:hypothetical protein AB205_0042210 [Aquarana catesbeiana]|uniref:Uncharacterized protein n=1 Tax=Aquarana catesbeiana TaxID=8400 RepID=A0A2G9RR70_AQUCT|nr:hypothetical protein AB205_0042210 [Aquarana catesbeiana]